MNAVLRTPQLAMGPELAAFEEALAWYHSVADAVVVSSGTAALHLALITLGIEPGQEFDFKVIEGDARPAADWVAANVLPDTAAYAGVLKHHDVLLLD